MSARMQPLIDEQAHTMAQRLRHTAQGDWLARYDPGDEEHMPAALHMAFLRTGIVAPDEHPSGGYMLTALGIAVIEELKETADATGNVSKGL